MMEKDIVCMPPGLNNLYQLCRNIYPDQSNPMQVSAVLKYWLGGPDPLDYVSMYSHDGIPEVNIDSHWHYISFGLSDLHGDGRVHEITGPGLPSGFGFELTFRLKKSLGEMSPPTWPASLMQSLARYVFNSRNVLCPGDHVSWNHSLDGKESSKICHILLEKDPQVPTIYTSCGRVEFVQIIGICKQELDAVQKWNGLGVINILKKNRKLGGEWLLTDMNRKSMFEESSDAKSIVLNGISSEGSTLSGVSCQCLWTDRFLTGEVNGNCFSEEFILKNCSPSEWNKTGNTVSNCMKQLECQLSQLNTDCTVRTLDSLHLILNEEAGNLLPLVINGRLKHGRHFTYTSVRYDLAVTFVAPNVTGSSKFVSSTHPYAVYGPWLQIYLAEEFIRRIEMDVINSIALRESLPKTFYWPERKFALTIADENKSDT